MARLGTIFLLSSPSKGCLQEIALQRLDRPLYIVVVLFVKCFLLQCDTRPTKNLSIYLPSKRSIENDIAINSKLT
jgi:hypothetical protein